MSDFVFVVPSDWTLMPEGFLDTIPVGQGPVQAWIDGGQLHMLEEELHNNNLLPLNHHILQAQIFNGDTLVLRLAIE